MLTYITRRLVISIPTLFGITVLAFLALSLAPGDPVTARVSPEILAQMTPDQFARLRHDLGLDDPLPVRYFIWLGGILQGDLGFSVVNNRPVAEDIQARIGPTLLLMSTSMVIGVVLGIVLGVISGIKQYSWLDYLTTGFSVSFIAIPGFVVGLAMIYILGASLKLLPTTGMTTIGEPFSYGDLVLHMIMPVTLLAVNLAAQFARYTRASVLEVLGSEFVTTARSKGLRATRVLWRHAFRNALIPIITVVGLTLPDLVAGAVITETLFGWQGMGQLAVKAAAGRDAALLMGVILVLATGVLIANLITDIAYAVADPRVRLGEQN